MAIDSGTLLEKGKVHFSTEGRLLQELGERLVASADLAVIELIKNAYDADSAICRVSFENPKTLLIEDEGHGMTLDEFLSNWMTIATSSKQADRTSRKYKRKLTGAKGIGRFAVRYLGKCLKLSSIAYDQKRKYYTRLEADFEWEKVDKLSTLEDFEIPYEVFQLPNPAQTGTRLTISMLRNEVIDKQKIRSEVLRIVSPLSGLQRGRFDTSLTAQKKDVGFAVEFLEGFEGGQTVDASLARSILDNCWAGLTITLEEDQLLYQIKFNYSASEHKTPTLKLAQPNHISNGLHADIRFFPRRAGIFAGKGVEGGVAWKWIRENAGVGVVDHGFRIKPYGFVDNDWLNLDTDQSRNWREWRTAIMQEHFPMSEEQKNSALLNPMLYIPSNLQLVGAVFVESKQKGDTNINDLIPAMDREGFIANQAFGELHDMIRAGIEYLAMRDKEEELERDEKKAKEATKDLKTSLRKAIEEVEHNPILPKGEKIAIVETYSRLAKEIDDVDEYHRTSRQNLELISLLGVVSGFMTHETERLVHELKTVNAELKALTKKYPSLSSNSERISSSLKELEEQIGYTSQFIRSIHNTKATRFGAQAQVQYVIDKFGAFAIRKGIEHIVEIDESILTPHIHIAIYSGVFLNLYTNAVKAILMRNNKADKGKVLVRAFNTADKHILEVFDNGVGIPESLRERIWDPLFTTTSNLNSPLGTGMGLGLSLVKKIVRDLGGSIRLVDPVKDFTTVFRVEFPMRPTLRN